MRGDGNNDSFLTIMPKITVSNIIQTSIVTAFTIAAALIWKDVIIEFIEMVVPSNGALLYKFIAAILATVFVIIAIYALLETESEANRMIKRMTGRKKN